MQTLGTDGDRCLIQLVIDSKSASFSHLITARCFEIYNDALVDLLQRKSEAATSSARVSGAYSLTLFRHSDVSTTKLCYSGCVDAWMH